MGTPINRFILNNQLTVIRVGLIIISILVITIFVNILSYINYQNKLDEDAAYAEKMKDFPMSIYVDKQFNNVNINSLISQCRAGSATYSTALSNQLTALSAVKNSNNFECFGQITPNDEQISKMSIAMSNFEDDYKCTFSFICFDLNSNSGFYHCPDFEIPTASTIKLPYVCSLLEAQPSAFSNSSDTISNILRYSDNTSFTELRRSYGRGCLSSWCSQLGISHDLYTDEYPEIATVRDMMRLWFKSYYLIKTFTYSEDLSSYMVGSKNSAIYNALSNKYTVLSKAGWWDGPDETTFGKKYGGQTSDGALVDNAQNPYLLFFFCDKCFDIEDLSQVINDIDEAHNSMFKSEIVFNTPEERDEYYDSLN